MYTVMEHTCMRFEQNWLTSEGFILDSICIAQSGQNPSEELELGTAPSEPLGARSCSTGVTISCTTTPPPSLSAIQALCDVQWISLCAFLTRC